MSLVYYGTVVSTKDPLALGRVQVKLRGFSAELTLTDVWLRMVVPSAGLETGFVFLPEVDDEVAILRSADDTVEGMLILGSVYNGKNKPIYSNADDGNITKEIRTKAGNAITITDKAGETAIALVTASGKIKVTLLDKEDGSVTIEGAKVVTVTSTDEMTLESKKITINASETLTLGGSTTVEVTGGDVAVSGSKIELTSDGDVVVSGTAIKLG